MLLRKKKQTKKPSRTYHPKIRLKTRLGELIAEKERRTNRRWTYHDINAATGVSPSTLTGYYKNRTRRYDAITVECLIEFFDCEIQDFFVVERLDKNNPGNGRR